MNIYVGKIGKSILFNPSSWGVTGGDNEAPKYYENLFHRNPSYTFYILGATDFSRQPRAVQERINKHGNVIDIWGGFVAWKKENKDIENKETNFKYLNWWIDKHRIKFDAGVIFAGLTGSTNIPGITTRMRDHTQMAKPLEMLCKYTAPLIYFMNESKVPYMLIVNDPRYFAPNARDWMLRPASVLSQYNETVEWTSKHTYDGADTYKTSVKSVYAEMETIFLIGLERGGSAANVPEVNSLNAFFEDAPPDHDGKDINFLIVLNEGRPSRYNLLKSAILNDVDDVEIYGKWDERVVGTDKRFKGSLGFHDLQRKLPHVKYTYCIPIKKGWVTSKFWEMAHYGIVPFLHPTYDEQDNLKAPDFLRVKDSKELFQKIKFLEDHPKAYQELRDLLNAMLKDGYYSGEALNDITITELNKIIQTK